MTRTTLLQRGSICVSDFRCSAGPDDTPFAEQFGGHSISYVRKGSFGCHSRGRFFELVAGSILVGHPGDEFICTHDHVCGDECLSFFLTPELVQAIGDRTEVWRVGASPPRGGNRLVDRCAFAPANRPGGRRRSGRHQPVPFPAAVFERARGDPAPVSGALATAPRGAPAGRR